MVIEIMKNSIALATSMSITGKDGKATRLDLTGKQRSVDLKDIFANIKDKNK